MKKKKWRCNGYGTLSSYGNQMCLFKMKRMIYSRNCLRLLLLPVGKECEQYSLITYYIHIEGNCFAIFELMTHHLFNACKIGKTRNNNNIIKEQKGFVDARFSPLLHFSTISCFWRCVPMTLNSHMNTKKNEHII